MAVLAQGTVLKIGSTSPTAIAGVSRIGVSISAEEIDVTTLASNGWKEFIGGVKEVEITLDLNFGPTETTHTQLLAALVDGTPKNFTLEFPNTSDTWTFSGVVTAFDIDAASDGKLEGSVTIKASGAVTL